MPPIRRYLRISKYSVLECRIFLENPADGPRWLLDSADPALPRVFEAVRPLVLPKLREENEKAKGKGKKKRSVKDVVVKDDFEVSVFLTDVGTRHALMVKRKAFAEQENAAELSGHPILLREDSGDVDLNDIPLNEDDGTEELTSKTSAEHRTYSDDKKKLGFRTTYDGFAIWGKVLCLLVERKGDKKNSAGGGSQVLMQEWIEATQQHEMDEDS